MNIGMFSLDESAMLRAQRRHGHQGELISRYVPKQPRFSWRGTPERRRWRMLARLDRLSIGQPEKRTGANAGSLAGRFAWNRRWFPTGSGPGLSPLSAFRRSYTRLKGPMGILP